MKTSTPQPPADEPEKLFDEEEQIGPFRTLRLLSRVRASTGYLARDVRSNREVLLRILRTQSKGPSENTSSALEGLQRIRHPGIARILDYGDHRGQPWYATELLEGQTLTTFVQRLWGSRRIAHEPRPSAAAGKLDTVVALMRRLCGPLAALHEQGFIHRDLKPDDVLLVDGQPVIVNFGLTIDEEVASRRLIELVDTLPYTSPERLCGEPMDARSDLYSLGCIFYEMLAGRPPFLGEAPDVCNQHLSEAPIAASQRVEGIPAILERLLERLLSKDRNRRVSHVQTVEETLAQVHDDTTDVEPRGREGAFHSRALVVGRESELSELQRLLRQAHAGTGALILLEGAAGIGKTHIARELTKDRFAEKMCIVATAVTRPEPETSVPLGALAMLLSVTSSQNMPERALFREPPADVLVAHEQPPGGSSHATMLLSEPPERRVRRFFGKVRDHIEQLAKERPVLWVIDDIQWADKLAVDFIASLAGEYIASVPVVLLCTYRADQANPRLLGLACHPDVYHLTVGRLSEAGVRGLVKDAVPYEEFPLASFRDIALTTERNPLFVRRYLQALVDNHPEYPPSLETLLEQRLEGLSIEAMEAISAFAVLGRETEFDILVEVARLSWEQLLRAIAELCDRRFLERTSPNSARFIHERIREVAYARLSDEQRVERHDRAADALRARLLNHEPTLGDYETIALHYSQVHNQSALDSTYSKISALNDVLRTTVERRRFQRDSLRLPPVDNRLERHVDRQSVRNHVSSPSAATTLRSRSTSNPASTRIAAPLTVTITKGDADAAREDDFTTLANAGGRGSVPASFIHAYADAGDTPSRFAIAATPSPPDCTSCTNCCRCSAVYRRRIHPLLPSRARIHEMGFMQRLQRSSTAQRAAQRHADARYDGNSHRQAKRSDPITEP